MALIFGGKAHLNDVHLSKIVITFGTYCSHLKMVSLKRSELAGTTVTAVGRGGGGVLKKQIILDRNQLN